MFNFFKKKETKLEHTMRPVTFKCSKCGHDNSAEVRVRNGMKLPDEFVVHCQFCTSHWMGRERGTPNLITIPPEHAEKG